MVLQFHPRAGTLLMCDFRGSVDPEINKRRPVVVVTPRLAHRDRLCMIVPTSTTAPKYPQPFQVQLTRNYHPNEPASTPVWAKCDLVMSVSMDRLDRFHTGKRQFVAPEISADDLKAIRKGIFAALGYPQLPPP
jgi:mRNA interferase MazF